MLDRKEALKILRLHTCQSPTHIEIEKAFRKLMRRYPAEVFPEKSLEIRKSYALLTNADEFWKDFISKESFDFSSIISYVKKNDKDSFDMETFKMVSDKDLLEKISAPWLMKYFDEEDYSYFGP